jgi:DNA-binding beta-propeller fold protein YncE
MKLTRQKFALGALLGFLNLCPCGQAQAAEQQPLRLIQTIPLSGVKGRFDHFSVDVKGRRLFCAALGNNTVEVIDLAAGKRLQTVPSMSKPTGVLFVPESNQILAANGADGTVKFMDGNTYKVTRTLSDFPDADNIRFDAAARLAWVGYGDGAIALLDPAAKKVLTIINLSGHPESFQLEKEGNRMFVNVPEARQLAVIDRKKRSIITTWPMEKFQANFPMASDEDNHRLFVGCRKPARLVVLDTNTGKPAADLGISGDTDDLFYDAIRKRIYISCGEGFVDVVEQRTSDEYKRAAQIKTAPGSRTSFFSAELDRFYLAVPERGYQKAELRVYQPE